MKTQVKELPTFKDVDFRNNMQRVYISDEEKEKLLDKLTRDVEVRRLKDLIATNPIQMDIVFHYMWKYVFIAFTHG